MAKLVTAEIIPGDLFYHKLSVGDECCKILLVFQSSMPLTEEAHSDEGVHSGGTATNGKHSFPDTDAASMTSESIAKDSGYSSLPFGDTPKTKAGNRETPPTGLVLLLFYSSLHISMRNENY